MTYREKAMIEHRSVDHCPSNYGYLDDPGFCYGMTTETFNKLLDELDGNSLETLKQKNAKYASPTDCLHNFDSGADIMGSTPAQCAWGYMTKHLVALRDKVQKNDFSDRDDLLEKCQDIINYIRFIWLIGNEEETKKKVN